MKLCDIARIIRSKNSGPFLLTLDIFIDEEKHYNFIKDKSIINDELICQLYYIDKSQIEGIYFFDEVQGIKITIQRDTSSGTFGDVDVYGAQQYIPLLQVEFAYEKNI